MKNIQKQQPPDIFVKYKKKNASFKKLAKGNYAEIKQTLRRSLLNEQGYICCYCGQEITMENSIIEHIKDRHNNPDLQLEYTNLVCSCSGGKDKRVTNPQCPLYCDASKEDFEIFVSPLDEDCENKFDFDEIGNIYGLDEDAKETIKTLNLNNAKLRNLRNSAIDAYRWLSDEEIDWQDELFKIKDKYFEDRYIPFCVVIKKYIENNKLQGELETV